MQILYSDHRFESVPIIVEALGYASSCLFTNMKDLGFEKREDMRHINKMQALVTIGTVKICKIRGHQIPSHNISFDFRMILGLKIRKL